MNKDYTHIVMIIDRSGSMWSMQSDAEGGVNSFIEEQKKAPGKNTLTLADFDSEYRLIHNFADIQSVGKYTLEPRGSTALNDAVGKTVVEVGKILSNLPEHERPGLVTVMIVSDGDENSSKEYKDPEVLKKIIELQQNTYNWQFNYLGTNQDAITAARNIGINLQGAANFTNVKGAYAAMSANTNRMRSAVSCDSFVVNSYTPEELSAMSAPTLEAKDTVNPSSNKRAISYV